MTPHSTERPNGDRPKMLAGMGAGTAVVLILVALLVPTERHGMVIEKNVVGRFWLLMVAGGLLQAALLCWLAALIVRALWFLPGRDGHVARARPDRDIIFPPFQPTDTTPPASAAASDGDGVLMFGVLSMVAVFALIGFFIFFAP